MTTHLAKRILSEELEQRGLRKEVSLDAADGAHSGLHDLARGHGPRLDGRRGGVGRDPLPSLLVAEVMV
jgi:hypothetical protein